MKILLTGGAGFIGSAITKLYLEEGHDVAVVDDLSTGRRENLPEAARLYVVDITDPNALAQIIAEERPRVVNHHAALVSVRESARLPDRYFKVNLEGTRNVLRAALAADVEKFIFASSGGAVYGEAQSLPIDENHPLKPLSAYGESKALAERLILEQDGRFESVILRYGNVYGPGQDPSIGNGAVAIFARRLLVGERVKIFGSGEQVRDYVYVADAARASLSALEARLSGTFNIGTGEGHSLLQVLDRLSQTLGVEPEIQFESAHPFEVWRNALDSSRAAQHLDWHAQVDFEEGVERAVKELIAHS